MIVLSLFDGGSCGQVALNNIGIKPKKYYASEIDKYAIKVTQENWPDTIQLGDATKWRDWGIDWSSIDLLIGGSPCQGFSYAGKQLLFDDPRSRLFFEYVDILNHIKKHNPNIKFMLENVLMKPIAENTISYYMGVDPAFINSALVSAQSRKRLYWANWKIEQPKDRGIVLADIIESGEVDRDKSYCIDANYYKGGSLNDYLEKSRRQVVCLNTKTEDRHTYQQDRIYDEKGKSPALMSSLNGRVNVAIMQTPRGNNPGGLHASNGKTPTLTANPWQENNKLQIREKSKTVRSSGLNSKDRHEWDSIDDAHTRKLTVQECEKLQGLPVGYTKSVSNTQAYKIIGNGWQVDTIEHIFKQMDKPLKQQLRLDIKL